MRESSVFRRIEDIASRVTGMTGPVRVTIAGIVEERVYRPFFEQTLSYWTPDRTISATRQVAAMAFAGSRARIPAEALITFIFRQVHFGSLKLKECLALPTPPFVGKQLGHWLVVHGMPQDFEVFAREVDDTFKDSLSDILSGQAGGKLPIRGFAAAVLLHSHAPFVAAFDAPQLKPDFVAVAHEVVDLVKSKAIVPLVPNSRLTADHKIVQFFSRVPDPPRGELVRSFEAATQTSLMFVELPDAGIQSGSRRIALAALLAYPSKIVALPLQSQGLSSGRMPPPDAKPIDALFVGDQTETGIGGSPAPLPMSHSSAALILAIERSPRLVIPALLRSVGQFVKAEQRILSEFQLSLAHTCAYNLIRGGNFIPIHPDLDRELKDQFFRYGLETLAEIAPLDHFRLAFAHHLDKPNGTFGWAYYLAGNQMAQAFRRELLGKEARSNKQDEAFKTYHSIHGSPNTEELAAIAAVFPELIPFMGVTDLQVDSALKMLRREGHNKYHEKLLWFASEELIQKWSREVEQTQWRAAAIRVGQLRAIESRTTNWKLLNSPPPVGTSAEFVIGGVTRDTPDQDVVTLHLPELSGTRSTIFMARVTLPDPKLTNEVLLADYLLTIQCPLGQSPRWAIVPRVWGCP